MWSLCEAPISTSNLKVLSQSFSTSTLQSSRNTPFENQSRLWLHDLRWACGILSCALKMGDQKHKMKSSRCVRLCLSSLSSAGCLNVSLQKLSTAKPNTLFPSYKVLWMCWCPVHLATQHRQIKKGEHDISVFGFVRTLLMQHWLQSTTPLLLPQSESHSVTRSIKHSARMVRTSRCSWRKSQVSIRHSGKVEVWEKWSFPVGKFLKVMGKWGGKRSTPTLSSRCLVDIITKPS